MRYVVLALLLAGCASTPPPLPTPTSCLPMKEYTQAQQEQLAKEVSGLAVNSMLLRAVVDYGQLRAANRACGKVETSR